MQVKCEYCGGFIEETAESCPNCGATNIHMSRAANGIPHTVEELRAFCEEHHVNTEKMHFHIGEDFQQPKAFGIFQNGEEFIVYKNKADGTRAIRYRGTDEAYAVNEIYQKLKAELQEVREHTAPARTPPRRTTTAVRRTGSHRRIGCLGWFLIIFFGIPLALSIIFSILQALGLYTPPPDNGYYRYNGEEYYYNSRDDSWYTYDDDAGWYYTDVDPYFADNYGDYWDSAYDGSTYSYDNGYDYTYDNNWDDDWDDDDWDWSSSYDDDDDWDWGSSYDSGSDWDWDWDSGSDWDSDW